MMILITYTTALIASRGRQPLPISLQYLKT